MVGNDVGLWVGALDGRLVGAAIRTLCFIHAFHQNMHIQGIYRWKVSWSACPTAQTWVHSTEGWSELAHKPSEQKTVEDASAAVPEVGS